MTDRSAVPLNPLVTIEVDSQGRLTINGHDVPHDNPDPREVATEVVCTDFAQPLGRPVRALANLPHEQIRMVIHPDGRVTDVEPHQPATPAGVKPATRAQAWLAARESDRVAAEVNAARHAGRRRRYPVVVAGAVAVAAAAALVVVVAQRGPASDEPSVAAPQEETPAADAPPAQSMIESTQIRPVAVPSVSAKTTPGVLRLSLAAQRRTTARVIVTPLDGSAGPQRLTLSIRGRTDRLVTLPALDPGRYEWKVLVPGQRRHTGVIRVAAVPPPVEVATDAVADDAAEQPGPDSNGTRPEDGVGGDDPPRPTGVSDGPNHPVDPDGD